MDSKGCYAENFKQKRDEATSCQAYHLSIEANDKCVENININ